MKRIITYMVMAAFCISLLAAPAFAYESDPSKPPPNTTPYENPNNLEDEGDDSGWSEPHTVYSTNNENEDSDSIKVVLEPFRLFLEALEVFRPEFIYIDSIFTRSGSKGSLR